VTGSTTDHDEARTTVGSQPARPPHDREDEAPRGGAQRDGTPQDAASAGGDGQAAASVEEREAVARDEDQLFADEDEPAAG
jgi:hypothetical protein